MPRAAGLGLAALLVAGPLAAQLWFSVLSLSGVYHETHGVSAERAGDNAAARAEFAAARAAVPFSAEYARLEATAALKSGDAEAAAPLLEESLRLAPYAPLSLTAAAEAYLDLGRTADAEAVIARAARIMPQEWRLHLMRGTIDLERGQIAPAVAELTAAALIADPPKYEVFYNLAHAHYAYGDPMNASRAAMRALRVQPFAVEARMLYGRSLLSTERIAEAHKEFAFAEQAYLRRLNAGENVELQLIEAQDLLSIALLADGRFDEAFAKFDELYVRLTPKQIDEFAWRLGDMTWRMREPFAPIALWARSLDLLAQTRRLEEFDASIEAIRLMCTGPEFDSLAAPRARAFTAGGNPERALEVLAEAPRDSRETPAYRLALAEALAATRQWSAARREYDTLLAVANLSPAIRKQAQARRAQIPAQ